MRIFQVTLNTFKKVNDFNKAASTIEGDIDVMSGRYSIDAKSIMGLYSLDLSKTLTVRCREEDYALFAKKLGEAGVI